MQKIVLSLLLVASFSAHALTKAEEKACDAKYDSLVAKLELSIERTNQSIQEARAVNDAQEVMELQKDKAALQARLQKLEQIKEEAVTKDEFCALVDGLK